MKTHVQGKKGREGCEGFLVILVLYVHFQTLNDVFCGFLLHCMRKEVLGESSTILTQGGETPGGAGVTAALATGFAAAALTHARPGDSAAG